MKKPKLIIDTDDLAYEGFQSRVSVVRHPINDPYSPLEDEEILEAYSDMIDALIETADLIECHKSALCRDRIAGAIPVVDEINGIINGAKNALIKAGCTDD